MRCPHCKKNVDDVAFCPHCGGQIGDDPAAANDGPRGQFKGRLNESGAGRAGDGHVSVFRAIVNLMADPRAPRSAKYVIVFAVIYIVLPLDFLPGGLIPVIGWLDDIIVGLVAWYLVKDDVQRYR